MMTGTMGINVFRAWAASIPFITGIDKSNHNQVRLQRLSLFNRVTPVLRLPAYVKARLGREYFAERVTDNRVVINY